MDWLVHVKVNCKEGTYRLNKQIIEDHLEPAFSRKKLDDITRSMIERSLRRRSVRRRARLRFEITCLSCEGYCPRQSKTRSSPLISEQYGTVPERDIE